MGNKQEKYSYLRNEPKNQAKKILEPFCGKKNTDAQVYTAFSGCQATDGKIVVSKEWAGVL
jgi:hypothetical protein